MNEHVNRIKSKRIAFAWKKYQETCYKGDSILSTEAQIEHAFYFAFIISLEAAIIIAANHKEEASFRHLEDIRAEFREFVKGL
jgi:hypothetical protein